MSDQSERLDSVERLARGSVDALGTLLEQHLVLARLMGALIAVLSADDAGLPARLAQITEAQGALSDSQREFLANFSGCAGGDIGEAMLDGVTAH
jgi:hypothetical protein